MADEAERTEQMDPQSVYTPSSNGEEAFTLTLTDEALAIIHRRMCGNAKS